MNDRNSKRPTPAAMVDRIRAKLDPTMLAFRTVRGVAVTGDGAPCVCDTITPDLTDRSVPLAAGSDCLSTLARVQLDR